MRHSKKSKGFSLIEVLIALVILSIALLALAGLMVQTTNSNSWGGHLTEAATSAQDKLEEFRVTRWEDVATGTDPTPPGPPRGATGIAYNRNWNVVQNGDLKTITITITWSDPINHSINFISAISR